MFEAIGVTWGSGDNQNTFNLPNFVKKVLVGSGGSRINGIQTTLGSVVTDEIYTIPLVSHTHSTGNNSHSINLHSHSYSIGSHSHSISAHSHSIGVHSHSVSFGSHSHSTGSHFIVETLIYIV